MKELAEELESEACLPPSESSLPQRKQG